MKWRRTMYKIQTVQSLEIYKQKETELTRKSWLKFSNMYEWIKNIKGNNNNNKKKTPKTEIKFNRHTTGTNEQWCWYLCFSSMYPESGTPPLRENLYNFTCFNPFNWNYIWNRNLNKNKICIKNDNNWNK